MYKEKYKICEEKKTTIWQDPNDDYQVLVQSKSVIIIGDGKESHFLPGKDEATNETACNVFNFLNANGIATHYIRYVNVSTFLARKVKIIPIKIVVRKRAFGSYLKRHLNTPEGSFFSPLVVEFFLKDDKNHDPLMIWDDFENKFTLCDAKQPLGDGWICLFDPLSISNGSLMPKNTQEIQNIRKLAVEVFRPLEKAWNDLGVRLIDLKIEVGFDVETNQLLVADVIDNDSWRIWPKSDKVPMKGKDTFRGLKEITPDAMKAIQENYQWVAEMTGRFKF